MSEPKKTESAESQKAYRWTCPVCQEANFGFATEKGARDAAKSALLSHLRIENGDGHGREHERPDGLDRDTILRHVEIKDGFE